MKGRLFLLLFALPFLGIGLWMTYSVGSTFYDARSMKNWVPVSATLSRAGYETQRGDDSYTYEAYASYNYQYEGMLYTGDRVSISSGADNLGDYQQDMGNRLSGELSRGESVTVFVDPQSPEHSIIDRRIRWALIGFESIFVFGFGGIGLGLIYLVFRTPKETDLSDPKYRDYPWLANDDWQSPVITSSSKGTMYATWGFAAFWNLVTAPLPFVMYREVVEKQNYLALVAVLFILVGAGLLVWAVMRTLEWRRFGAAPLTMDPFPGSIGGHVGGHIDLNLPFDSDAHFSLTLTLLHSYVSGSGKNRSRTSSAKWQDTQGAHVAAGVKGSRLRFRFDVPEGLSESDADQREDSYYIWQLNLAADLPGVDIDRDYEIPVYATREQSRELSGFSIQEARADQEQIDIAAVKKLARFSYGASGPSLLFPIGRDAWNGLVGILCGGIFAGAGWFLATDAGHVFMGTIFGGVGTLILLSGLYFALNSLEVATEGGDLVTVRRILGVIVKRGRMRRADFLQFSKKKSSFTRTGTKHVVHYSVHAVDSQGLKLVVGEGFKGVSQADTAADLIAKEFGLVQRQSLPELDSVADEPNLLATD